MQKLVNMSMPLFTQEFAGATLGYSMYVIKIFVA